MLSFVLVKAKPAYAVEEVCDSIQRATGLSARTRDHFVAATILYCMRETGIPVNFGITVLLGFIVGTAIAGQSVYLFTVENIRQFAMLQAHGTTNRSLMGMILVQAMMVGLIGYGIGVGGAAVFGWSISGLDRLAFIVQDFNLLPGLTAAENVAVNSSESQWPVRWSAHRS